YPAAATPPPATPSAGYPAADPAPVPPVTQPFEDPADKPDRKRPLLLAGAALAVLLVVLLVVLLNRKTDPPNDQAGPTDTTTTTTAAQPTTEPQQPQATSNEQPTTTVQPTTTTSTTTAPAPQPGTADKGLTDYYALLPGNTEAGWSRLTESFKASRPNLDRAEYERFWGNIASVQLSGVTLQAPDRVSATVTYLMKSGGTENYFHTFTLVQVNGTWMIDSQS
ncbi:MAG: hypothetical protein HOY78_46905, partial [Saccharothrix sp.]|nr:hypothetical protein [Saccharothrix sp.]